MEKKIDIIDNDMIICLSYKNMEYKNKFKLCGSGNKTRRKKLIRKYEVEAIKQMNMILFGEKFFKIIEDLVNHITIWYPNVDVEMATNRKIELNDVKKETIRLKLFYKKMKDRIICSGKKVF